MDAAARPPDTTTRAARTLRRRLLSIPGRLTRHACGWTLHLPARWPWHGDHIDALNRIRAIPATARRDHSLTEIPAWIGARIGARRLEGDSAARPIPSSHEFAGAR
jgi:hypothetical protein